MATAAQSIGVIPASIEAGPVPLPGIAELFAALVAGAGADGEQAGGDKAALEVAPEDVVDGVETSETAATLLPMLDQQRAAAPAAKLIELPVDEPSPARVSVAPAATPEAKADQPVAAKPVSQPAPGPEQTTIVAPAGSSQTPATDKHAENTPAAKENLDTKPTVTIAGKVRMKQAPLVDGKETATEVVITRQAPDAAKVVSSPAAIAPAPQLPVADQAPAARPIAKAAAPKQDAPTPIRTEKASLPVAPATPQAIQPQPPKAEAFRKAALARPDQVEAVQPDPAPGAIPVAAIKPAPAAPLQAETGSKTAPPASMAQLLPVAAPVQSKKAQVAQAKPGETTVVAPEAIAVATEAQKISPSAKTRAARYAIAPAIADPDRDAAAATQTASVAMEARTPVQAGQATQPFIQLAAPISAPAQPVATAIAQQVLDLSSGDAWIDQIARDISQTAGKDGAMRFRLAPETLGELRVEITHSERGAHVRMAVTSEQAQQALAAAEPKLAAEARAQGVRIAETEISFTGGQGQGRELGRQAQEQAQTQNGQSARTPRGNAATPSFTDAAEPSRSRRTDRYA